MLPKYIFLCFLLLITISAQTGFKDCNFTDYRFQSDYNLGKQDQLNNTFDAINGKFTIPNIVYPVNSYTNYTLTSINTTLSYIDARQKAQIMGNDTIAVVGGYLEAVLTMNWARKDFLERGGSVKALCKSDEVMFSKNLTIDRGFLLYEVQEYYNVTFDFKQCEIVRYEPANASDLDLSFIRQLLNTPEYDKQPARILLAEEINKKYLYELNNSLYNEKHQLDNKFVYQWKDQTKGKTIDIEYQVLPTGVDLEIAGLSFTFVTEIKNYDKWECGATIPHQNLDVNKYGGIQEFVSLSVFQNTLKYGIQIGVLDTKLNNANWKSRMFQFYAGDLYEVIPQISKIYLARQQITGTCKGSSQNTSIFPEQKINDLIVRTGHACQLFIKGTTKILEIRIDLYTHIEAKFQEEAKVNFYIKGFTHNLSYLEQPSFKIQNYPLANQMLLNSLNKLLNTKTFGSGWPIFNMDLPEFKVMAQGYLVFYDTSHVGPSKCSAE